MGLVLLVSRSDEPGRRTEVHAGVVLTFLRESADKLLCNHVFGKNAHSLYRDLGSLCKKS